MPARGKKYIRCVSISQETSVRRFRAGDMRESGIPKFLSGGKIKPGSGLLIGVGEGHSRRFRVRTLYGLLVQGPPVSYALGYRASSHARELTCR